MIPKQLKYNPVLSIISGLAIGFVIIAFVRTITVVAFAAIAPPKEQPPIAPQLEIVQVESSPFKPKPPDLPDKDKLEKALWDSAIKSVTDAIKTQGKEIKEAAVEQAKESFWIGVGSGAIGCSLVWAMLWLISLTIRRRTT